MENTLKDLSINELKTFLNKMRIKFGSKNHNKAYYLIKLQEGLADAKKLSLLSETELVLLNKARKIPTESTEPKAKEQKVSSPKPVRRVKFVKPTSEVYDYLKSTKRYVPTPYKPYRPQLNFPSISLNDEENFFENKNEMCSQILCVFKISSLGAFLAFLYFYKHEETINFLKASVNLLQERECQITIGLSVILLVTFLAVKRVRDQRSVEKVMEEVLVYLQEGERTLFSREDLVEMAKEKGVEGEERQANLVKDVEASLELSDRFRKIDSVASIWMRIAQ